MRRIHVEKLKEGMTLSKPIYSSGGIVLLSEGSELTDRYIDKIIATGLKHIYILDEISKGIQMDELITEETKNETKKVLQDGLSKMKAGYFNTSGQIIKKVEAIILEVLSNPRVMVSVQEIRNKSEHLHMHAINVCALSVLLGKKLNYSDVQLKQLAIGALLHDLGKLNIKFDCSRYREDYICQEFELYMQHCNEGYEMIQEISEVSLMSANVLRMHHENYDGTGFPFGIKGSAIHEFAKIVAVTNEYDNLVYNLPYGFQMKHYEIIEMIIAKSFTQFDPQIVRVFMNSISPYPLGSGVVLSDGQRGIVSLINENFPTRPRVRVIDPTTMQVIHELDLSKIPSLLIVDEKDIDK